MRLRAFILIAVVALGGCRNQPLNPARLVTDNETDVAIQLFIQASIMMLQAYQFDTIPYDDIKFRSERAGFRVIPFMPPDSIRATPQLIARMRAPQVLTLDDYVSLMKGVNAKAFVKYYIRTGLRASQLICRNHLTRLDEGNQYVEFLKRELGVGAAFASGVLAVVNANATLTKSFLIAVTGVNDGLDAFQEYRFLTIDRDAARVLVETAQNKLAAYYLDQVDDTDNADLIGKKLIPRNNSAGGYTYSDALNAVSVIEYQCTREGIRFLLNRSINNSPSNMDIDTLTGTVMFKSAKDQNGQDVAPPPTKGISGAGADAFEKSLGSATLQKWATSCGFPAGTKLADNNGALRKALHNFSGMTGASGLISQAEGIVLINKFDRGQTGCAPV